MKKIFALLLTIAICISLSACGSSSDRELLEKYETIINNLENGHYENAIDLIENMENSNAQNGSDASSSKPELTAEQLAWQSTVVGSWIPDKTASEEGYKGWTINADKTCVLDGKSYTWVMLSASDSSTSLDLLDGDTKVYRIGFSKNTDYGYNRATLSKYADEYMFNNMRGTYYRNEEYTVAEVNGDNWQEYFEIKEVLSANKNSFGEVDKFIGYTYLRLKDSYGTVNANLSSVAVEYKSLSVCQDITVDINNMTYTPVGKVSNTSEHGSTTEMRMSTDNNNTRYYGISIGSFTAHDVDKSLTDTVWRPTNNEIVRIQGTVYILKK